VKDKLDVLLVGVGGQGVVTLARLLSEAALKCGFNVMLAETRGLSQRGGSVKVFLRIGKVYAPIFDVADVIIGLELTETLRNMYYAGENTVVIVNNRLIPVNMKKTESKKLIIEKIMEKSKNLEIIDAEGVAINVGSIRSENIAMLGYISTHNIFRSISTCIDDVFYSSKYAKIRENIEAYKIGRKLR